MYPVSRWLTWPLLLDVTSFAWSGSAAGTSGKEGDTGKQNSSLDQFTDIISLIMPKGEIISVVYSGIETFLSNNTEYCLVEWNEYEAICCEFRQAL